jgi:hypothetical protein
MQRDNIKIYFKSNEGMDTGFIWLRFSPLTNCDKDGKETSSFTKK